ncbi:LOW QUALITY PROTEIN: hypothetical protein CVT25_013051 [Psilocybe cyanescens]|uniref:Uncharacterized protein n=1 Tax=Psilocybe cyanescens TaxID=93625 RepID=A0A409XK54_PSICY|nr:LOW QUALITY PROTEIN: hypothetical protein CVT25_013051 [Psilocybe cyanescens]
MHLSTPDRATLWLSARLFRLGSPTRMASQSPFCTSPCDCSGTCITEHTSTQPNSKLHWAPTQLHHLTACACRLPSVAALLGIMFQDPEYRGWNFLQLKMVDGAVAQPGGKDNPWVHFVNMISLQLYACMCRCILNHAPIRSYYSWFNLNDGHTLCSCGCPWETRTHILTCKRTYGPPKICKLRQPTMLCYLHSFLEMNPKAFAFRSAPLWASVDN